MHHLIESWWNFGTAHLGRDLVSLGGYLFIVIVVNLLGRQRRRLAEIAQQQRDELASEIHLAAEVQQNILPRTVPSLHGFEIAARMTPAKEVAGDYYGFIEQADGSVSLVIADVSGKGVAAGLLMPSIEIALRLDSPRHSRAHELIENFNGVVCQLTAGSRFISMFYARVWPATRRIEYTNAGHNPPLLLREGSAQQLSCGGPVLGILPEAKYESEFMELRKDDVLLLYTDGLVEAENPAGVFYSTHRLISIALANTNSPADKIVEAVYASVTEFRGKPIMEDDATLVVVKVL
jgi:sigma-B regulation protein RsbU (phosphoserine phosphatase)